MVGQTFLPWVGQTFLSASDAGTPASDLDASGRRVRRPEAGKNACPTKTRPEADRNACPTMGDRQECLPHQAA